MTAASLPKIELFCTTGGASKEYHLHTVDHGNDTFTLYYSNGAIGAAMTPKVKAGPGTLSEIQKEFDKTVKSKTKASPPYTEASSGVTYSTTQDAGDQSGWMPQLLSEIESGEAETYLTDDSWHAQEKKNGQRRAVLVKDGEVRGANKKGRFIGGVPQAWADAMKLLPNDTILDGEHVGDVLHVFDVTRFGGKDCKAFSFDVRMDLVNKLSKDLNTPKVQALFTARGTAAKRQLLATITDNTGEGVVFSRASATYAEGRASSAKRSDRIKLKIYEFSNCLVLRKNAGASVALGLLDANGNMVEVGSVTIPPNQPFPKVGDVQRVRYMHMFEAGSLYGPPVSFGPQAGVDPSSCTLAQVKRVISKASAAAMSAMDDDDYAGEEPEVAIQRERQRG